MHFNNIIALLIIAVNTMSCNTGKSIASNTEQETVSVALSEPVVVYKTRNDYSENVSVLLSEDRSQIISYPAPVDIRRRLNGIRPVSLQNGYLLDRRGISGQVAFLSYTYEEYAALKQAPSLEEMKAKIIDARPLLEYCDCGSINDYADVEQELNKLIEGNRLGEKCRVVKF